jgi:hypothetical protein
MNTRYIPLAIILIISILWRESAAQGCVAIRQFSNCSGGLNANLINLDRGEWQLAANYRYFKSFRHFRGDEEQPERIANNTEVINWSHAWDLNVAYGITPRLFGNFTLPFVYNERSSLYEHGRQSRHMTFSGGLADIRLGLGYWLLDPAKHHGGNISLGLGVKIPSGDYNAQGAFKNVGLNGAPEMRPVDQSIQPGDGGWGITADAQLFQTIANRLFVYGNAFYLINPRGTNSTRTYRETLSALLTNESIMSVPDQFGLRFGLTYGTPLPGLALSFGGRMEGVPVRDLIGDSAGFRRPGYVLSVEPGLVYGLGRWAFNLNVPVAVYRNRTQSMTDKETQQETGNPRHGDAAFADYLVGAGVFYRLGKKMAPGAHGPMWEER